VQSGDAFLLPGRMRSNRLMHSGSTYSDKHEAPRSYIHIREIHWLPITARIQYYKSCLLLLHDSRVSHSLPVSVTAADAMQSPTFFRSQLNSVGEKQ